MRIFIGVVFASVLFACSEPSPVVVRPKELKNDSLEEPPTAVTKAITSKFRGAVPFKKGIDSVLKHLKQLGIYSQTMLWGQSICVDDITNTKNKLSPEIKGPFNIGGLAGLPFTGITGLDAFAHHVPEDGTAILFIGPHIGYNEKDGWGKILRHEQHHSSTCCGALVAALGKLQKGELKYEVPAADDYQEGMIEQFAYTHRNEILSSSEPLIPFTQLTYHETIRQMSNYALKLKERHFKYVVVVGVIIINTDYMFTDYLSIEALAIRDVQKNVWIEGEKPN
jgi:hypothetical protein